MNPQRRIHAGYAPKQPPSHKSGRRQAPFAARCQPNNPLARWVRRRSELAQLDQVSEHGGWLNKDELEYLQLLQAGGRRGAPLPAAPAIREPFINGIGEDFEVRVAKTAAQANVVVLFSHERWPGVRFGHRFPPPGQNDGYEHIWLKEEIETGALARLMNRDPTPDSDGVIWTDWGHR